MNTGHNYHSANKEDPLGRLAARQFGVFSRGQALERGVGPDAINYRLRSGEWQRLHPGVYRMRGAPPSWEQRLMAATLWAGPESAVSHRSAAALWKLDGIDADGVVELTTPRCRNPDVPKGITLHRTKLLGPSDAGWLGALRVTGLARTLIDLGAVVSDPAVVEAAMESALRRDEQLFDRMVERLGILGGHGRRGAGVLRELLALRDPDAAPTEGMFETLIERLLRRAGIEMPVRQYEVWDGDEFIARIDFGWLTVTPHVGLEPRGYWCHSGRARFQSDTDRANRLARTRWRIVYATWQDLVRRPEKILDPLQELLA
ncbi:MAG TPA: type IV toxin-antitoxin system AbiEi family antitoxin domain-containing protein [Actinomycetota bacterium]